MKVTGHIEQYLTDTTLVANNGDRYVVPLSLLEKHGIRGAVMTDAGYVTSLDSYTWTEFVQGVVYGYRTEISWEAEVLTGNLMDCKGVCVSFSQEF